MFRFNHHHQGAHYSSFAEVTVAAATPPNQPQRRILTDYFNNYNFSKAQIMRYLMMVIKPKHTRAVLM
jgi:hypothetical protein